MGIKKNETLDKYAINISIKARNGELEKFFGREDILDDLIKILSRKKKNNAILVGFAGTGKTVITEGLAQKIVEQKVPIGLLNKVLYSIDAASITAGTQYRGQMEERLKKILQEAEEDEDIILFIDEIHTILDNGSSNSLNIANIMKPHLTSGKLQVIGATTFDEHKKFFEKDGALSRRFNKVTVDEPTIDECVKILKQCAPGYEKYHGVKFDKGVLDEIPVLAKKYIKDRFLPDSAIDILDTLGAKLKVEKTKPTPKLLKLLDEMEENQITKRDLVRNEDWAGIAHFKPNVLDKLKQKIEDERKDFIENVTKNNETLVTKEDVLSVVSTISKIPLDSMNKDGKENITKLENLLTAKFINQDEAKSKVLKALKRYVMGFNDSNRPVASLLLLGKSGSGKTYLSKLVADAWYNGNMVRIDMSEYQEKISSTALIGSPPGYVGYEQGGSLTEKVRRNPYSIILFDEIEKAHKDILNTLLQVLDEGHITDSQGRDVDFKNCIIIMTSNLGARDSEYKKPSFGGGSEVALETTSIDAAKKHFTPEFWNRIDQVIVFNPLTKIDMVKILELELEKVSSLLKNTKNIKLVFLQPLKDILIEKGFDSKLGARPLKRAVENILIDEITDYLLVNGDQFKKLTIGWDTATEKVVIKSN